VAAYFETEDVVKEYDSAIFTRILSYLKPHKGLALCALASLALSTGGELLLPLLQQRVIDRAIVVKFLALRPGAAPWEEILKDDPAGNKAFSAMLSSPASLRAGGMVFAPLSQAWGAGTPGRLSKSAEERLRETGLLDRADWYAFRFKPGSKAAQTALSRPDLFLMGDGEAALPAAALASLPLEDRRAVKEGDIAYLYRAGLLLLASLIAVFAFTFAQTWSASRIGQEVMKDLRLALFTKTASQSTAFLSRHPVGRVVTRLTSDVETINEFFTSVLIAFLKDFSIMAGSLAALFALSPPLALVVLAILPPVLGVTAISRVKARDAFRLQRAASSRVNSYLSERLSGLPVVQLFQKERLSGEEFRERSRSLLGANLGEMYVNAFFRPSVEWFAAFTTAAVIAVGARMALSLSLSLGALIAFINLIGMFYSPLQDIAEKYTLLQSAMAGGERVFAFLDASESIPDLGHTSIEGRVKGRLEFDNVRFSYTGREEVLRGLSFTVEPGEMAAIVGATGAGKTTITNVLTRLWDLTGGEIRLDGTPIQDIPLAELRRSCLPVLQDVFLFSGTVADNIRLGLDLTDAQVEAAARAVYAHDFITSLPEGYRTMLSEGASNISAGQRQLISFARVIARNPAIVILDEATSSVDTETERLIQLGMGRVLAGRTSIVIAHRLSTIRHADRILALAGGRIVEEGTHESLLAANGLYAGLYRLQYE